MLFYGIGVKRDEAGGKFWLEASGTKKAGVLHRPGADFPKPHQNRILTKPPPN